MTVFGKKNSIIGDNEITR